MFMIQCFELVMLIGFDDNILPEAGQFITVFIWPAAVLIFTIGMMVWTVLKKGSGNRSYRSNGTKSRKYKKK